MLDYTLVSPLATYRMPTPRDLPGLVSLVQAFYREDAGASPGPEQMTPERVLATVNMLAKNKDRGSLFVFERGAQRGAERGAERNGALVGYAIIIQYWSNELGGMALVVDELYVEPGSRGHGIASDFLGLLSRVAPPGTAAIQLEVSAAHRRALGLYRKLGFRDSGRQVYTLPVVKAGPAAPPGATR